MRKLCGLIILLTSLFHHHPAHAQIATLTGNVNNINTVGQAGGIRVMQVIYELHSLGAGGVDQLGCGTGILPRVTGSGVALATTQWPYTPSGTGAMTGSIYRNDFIDCAGVTPTFYKVYMVNAGSKSLFGSFKIDSTTVVSGNFNFTTATGLTGASFTTPVGTTPGAVLLNPAGSQIISIGDLTLTNGSFIAGPTGTASSGTNFGSYSVAFRASSWNGSAAQTDQWTLTSGENPGTNPVSFLLLGGPGRAQTWQLVFSSSVGATSGLNVNGPDVMLRGNFWNGASSANDDWHITPTLGSGTNPSSTFAITHSGTPGSTSVQVPSLQVGGSDTGFCRGGSPGFIFVTDGSCNSNGNIFATSFNTQNQSAIMNNATGLIVGSGGGVGSASFSQAGTATVSNNFGSTPINFKQSIWNGSSASTESWSLNAFENTSGTNPTSYLSFQFNNQLNRTSQPGLLLLNASLATSGQNYGAPYLQFVSSYWNGAGSVSDFWTLTPTLGTGTNPTSTLVLSHGGSSGVSAFDFGTVPAKSSHFYAMTGGSFDGTFADDPTSPTYILGHTGGSAATLKMGNGFQVAFVNSVNASTGTVDSCLGRAGVGILKLTSDCGGSTPVNTALLVGRYLLGNENITLANGLNSNIQTTNSPNESYYEFTGPTAAFSLGGFVPSASGFKSGQLLKVFNDTAQQMTIVNLDASSTAGNRILTLTGANVVLRTGNSFASFIYSPIQGVWILTSTN